MSGSPVFARYYGPRDMNDPYRPVDPDESRDSGVGMTWLSGGAWELSPSGATAVASRRDRMKPHWACVGGAT